MTISSDQRMQQVTDSFVARLRKGESPSIDDYKLKHPELAEEIEDVFPALKMLEMCGPDREQPVASSLSVDDAVPDQLGEYRIVQEIGRGGMGVVYEAEHETMCRRVALKVLPKSLASNRAYLQRFLREARSAGQLHHSNIVPVFEVGEHAGMHFYAMQFIRGQNLDLVMEEVYRLRTAAGDETPDESPQSCHDLSKSIAQGLLREPTFDSDAGKSDDVRPFSPASTDVCKRPIRTAPTTESTLQLSTSEWTTTLSSRPAYFRRVAGLAEQVAHALSYAHQNNLLHRDVKPANLILDTAGVVWVTDFGLAKTEDDDLTQSGDIVGTLRYMAPERFDGCADVRSDVYSLGLTLYELCTLRHAYHHSDRAQLIRRLTQKSPTRPRQIDRMIPRDLETIILKAIERDPDKRYQTAQQFADDLRLFQTDRPIKARRSSQVEQAWKWSRRNPALASLISCIALLLVVVFVGALTFAFTAQHHANELWDETIRAQQAEYDTRVANLEAKRSLYSSYVGEANASRWSRRVGRRYQTLDVVEKASNLLPELFFDQSRVKHEELKLRNIAIAAMPLVDVRVLSQWPLKWPMGRFALSSDGELMAQSDTEGNIHVFRVTDRELVTTLTGVGVPTWLLEFDKSTRYIAATSIRQYATEPSLVSVWEIATGKQVVSVEAPAGDAAFDFSPDGQTIAISRSIKEIEFYSLATGQLEAKRSTGIVTRFISYAPSGEKIAIAGGRTVEVHHLESEQVDLITTTIAAYTICWSPDHRLAVGDSYEPGHIEIYQPDVSDVPLLTIDAHRSRVSLMSFSPDGRMLKSNSWDGTQVFWDSHTGQRLLTVDEDGTAYSGFAKLGSWMPYSIKGACYGIWEVSTGAPAMVTHIEKNRRVNDFDIHPTEPRIVAFAVAPEDQVEFWDIKTSRRLLTIDGHIFMEIGFAPDGSLLTTGIGNDAVHRWPIGIQVDSAEDKVDLQVGEPIVLFTPQRQPGRGQRFALDSKGERLVVTNSTDSATVIDLTGEGDPIELDSHPNLEHVAINPAGNLVVTSTWHGHGLRLWDVDSGEFVKDLLPDGPDAYSVFSPDGRWLAAVTREGQYVWDTATWKRREIPLAAPIGHRGPLQFSPDSRLVLTAHSRSVPRLIDLESLEVVAVLESGDYKHGKCCFTPTGDQIVTTTSDGFRVWDLKSLRSGLADLGLDWQDD